VSGFSQAIQANTRKPPGFVLLEPSAFADDWQDKPRAAVAIGVTPLSETQTQIVKASAAKIARELYPESEQDDDDIVHAYEDKLMTLAVARATTDANDASRAYFACPDDDVPAALTSGAIRRLWDELERVTIATNPNMPEADEDDLAELPELLGHVDGLTRARGIRLRKLLRFCVDELRAVKEAIG